MQFEPENANKKEGRRRHICKNAKRVGEFIEPSTHYHICHGENQCSFVPAPERLVDVHPNMGRQYYYRSVPTPIIHLLTFILRKKKKS